MYHFSKIVLFIHRIFNGPPKSPPPPLFLRDFIEKKVVSDDEWNKIKNGNVRYEYFKEENDIRPFGYIQFRPTVGQIGLFFIFDKNLRGRGLGKQMLLKAIQDIKEHGKVDTIWAVTLENHEFWSNVWNKSFTWKDPPHSTVTSGGYKLKI